jgi:hypothetical protein
MGEKGPFAYTEPKSYHFYTKLGDTIVDLKDLPPSKHFRVRWWSRDGKAQVRST